MKSVCEKPLYAVFMIVNVKIFLTFCAKKKALVGFLRFLTFAEKCDIFMLVEQRRLWLMPLSLSFLLAVVSLFVSLPFFAL